MSTYFLKYSLLPRSDDNNNDKKANRENNLKLILGIEPSKNSRFLKRYIIATSPLSLKRSYYLIIPGHHLIPVHFINLTLTPQTFPEMVPNALYVP